MPHHAPSVVSEGAVSQEKNLQDSPLEWMEPLTLSATLSELW